MNIEWMVIRGSGIVAFALLSASSIWGLLVSTKVLGRAVKAKPVTWFHESLGLGALIATVVHMVALTMDDFIEFGWADVLVPGMASWNSMAVSFGVMAFYGLAVVALSFYVKGVIGQKAWRTIHFLAFGAFLAALVHGIMAGTDSGHPTVVALYFGAALLIVALVAIRVIQQRAGADRPTVRRPVAGAESEPVERPRVSTAVGD
jgi:sulfoxide reductase heme-binding subunit YedZ